MNLNTAKFRYISMRRSISLLKILFCATLLFSCAREQEKVKVQKQGTSKKHSVALAGTSVIDTALLEASSENETATYFVVVADTGMDYYMLQKKMFALNNSLKYPIDTMGRYFNPNKNLIVLPDNDEDEMYRGDYFPRRFPSENLSLEYLNFYDQHSKDKTIALVTGIYEHESSADSALRNVKIAGNKAFKIKSEVFVGCMH